MNGTDLIRREDAIAAFIHLSQGAMEGVIYKRTIDAIPAVDAVPWEFLERYADWFCAVVSMPEFIREAKAFYYDTYRAMEGGGIERREDGDGDG